VACLFGTLRNVAIVAVISSTAVATLWMSSVVCSAA
jgi:hypothetical protein